MKKPQQIRCLIYRVEFNRRLDRYEVGVLQADSANLATDTGIASTLLLTKDQVQAGLKMFELKSPKDLRGAPVQTTVKYEGGNVLGSSSFDKFVY